jgi:hypothetical protein
MSGISSFRAVRSGHSARGAHGDAIDASTAAPPLRDYAGRHPTVAFSFSRRNPTPAKSWCFPRWSASLTLPA